MPVTTGDASTTAPKLDDSSLYFNRELSLLAFQKRVLEEARDPGNPLLERLNFLSIFGSNTGLDFPVGLDVDAAGNIYVSNLFANSITVYAPTARGNAAPTATLSGSATGLSAPQHLAVSPPLAILTDRLPPARVAHRYRTRLIATLGVGRYHWTIRRGHLPRGLRLNARNGVLAGTPRQQGTFRVRVKVTDSSHPANAATQSLALTVKPANSRRPRSR